MYSKFLLIKREFQNPYIQHMLMSKYQGDSLTRGPGPQYLTQAKVKAGFRHPNFQEKRA